MKCIACDVLLNDFESTRKYEDTNEYVDLCGKCFDTLELHPDERHDLEGEGEHWVPDDPKQVAREDFYEDEV